MLKASKNYQKLEHKNETFKGCCKSEFNLQTAVGIAEKEKLGALPKDLYFKGVNS